MKETNDADEQFSDDAEENLRIENELLKLKMQAESGAFFGGSGNLSPDIENAFLQNIQQFEAAWQHAKPQKVYDLLGKPHFKNAATLQPTEVDTELEKLLDILADHNMALDVLGNYEPIVIYRFITEELFEHESDGMGFPGMTMHYIYEEFHPNHQMDIESSVKDFFTHWFQQHFNEYSTELANEFVLPDGTQLNKEQAIRQFDQFFDCFTRFFDTRFVIGEISFQWNDDKGLGHAEGAVHYKAELENGEITVMDGPFKLYLSNEYGGWDIFSFVMPGFRW